MTLCCQHFLHSVVECTGHSYIEERKTILDMISGDYSAVLLQTLLG